MTLINLDVENEPEKYIEAYERIAEAVDAKAKSESAKEQIRQAFYNKIDSRFKEINSNGLGMQEYIQKEQVAKEREIKRVNYAKSFNEFYEYDVVTIINEDHGTIGGG